MKLNAIPRALETRSDLSRTAGVLMTWIAASLLTVLIWGFTLASGSGVEWWSKALGTFGHASIVSGGALAVGVLLGFLFGIPRTVQQSAASPSSTEMAGVSSFQSTNTNLEQISDWLTKILVGVGLTQLQSLRSDLAALGSYFVVADAPPITLALILNFWIAGFLAGYLLTRLFLTGAFVNVERSLRERTNKAEELQEAGDFGAALDEYESALRQITPTTPSVQRIKIYEGLIFNSLYEPPPKGYQTAIGYALRYLKEELAQPSGQILAFLAAAYGQQYSYERSHGALSDRLSEIREKAIEAVKRALKTDPGTLTLLRMMWDPAYPSKSPGDNDLEVFFEDSGFRDLLKSGN